MGRGSLRIYLGASPGVGKTFAMLNEGHRRVERNADVVVGIVETHGRVQTAAQLRSLEVVPRRQVEHRGTTVEEMDLAAILARRPQIVLVDELAHTNAPGSTNDKRWQDVEVLLDAGIDVISTLNIQHLESLNDVVSRITGTTQRETVPDAVVRRADQLELVDMSPEAIRRRMAHGNIYPAERVDAAMANWFRPGNLGALRELALLWVADRVEDALATYQADQGITDAWETRERVVVGITGGPAGEALIRRAARIAGRVGGDFIGVHVVTDDGLSANDGALLAAQRRLVEQLGGTVHQVSGGGRAEALVAFARAEKATQLVVGATARSRWYELWHGSLVADVTRRADDLDVHVIARLQAEPSRSPSSPVRRARQVDRRRQVSAWGLTVIGLPLLCAVLVSVRQQVSLGTSLLLFLAVVLTIAAVGGVVVAVVGALGASLLVNWYLVEPFYTLTIAEPQSIVALVVFLAVAITVGLLVDLAARRAAEARLSRLEAVALARSAATLAADPEPLPGLAEQVRSTFALEGVRVARYDNGTWNELATSGTVDPEAGASSVVTIGGSDDGADRHRLEMYGRSLSGDERRVLRALADQLTIAIERQRLTTGAAHASALADIDAVRTGLLRAVSHDLRTPLASIKAMVSGLLDPEVDWSDAQLREALVTVDEETDRLNRLVGNLLDASRLQTGALAVNLCAVDIDDTVSAALASIGPSNERVRVDLPAALPQVCADGALLERALANVVANALHHGGPAVVHVTAGAVNDQVHVRVVDRGPGIALSQREQVMVPFQRLGDGDASGGVGLGMTIADGFVAACGGRLWLDDTPGGGLTVTVSLPMTTVGVPLATDAT